MKDVILGAVLTNGRDDFHTGRKVTGHDSHIAELSIRQQKDYFHPFVASATRHSVESVVLHDGLSESVMKDIPVRFCCAVALPDWNAFERRWVAILNWLNARDDVRRVWMVDTNDILFLQHPFHWMDRYLAQGQIAVGRESVLMGGNVWFESGVKPLPSSYAEFLIGKHGSSYGLSCGCWGTDRLTAISILNKVVEHIDLMQRHVARIKPSYPICLDMFAFGFIWRNEHIGRLVPFSMDGETQLDGVSSPLLHDRKRVMDQLV